MTKTTVDQTSQRNPLKKLPETVFRHHGQTLLGPMKEWQKRKQAPPVLLLTGQTGIGKKSIAYFIAQWILCERSGFSPQFDSNSSSLQLSPCNQCSSCLKILSGNQVDLVEISSETDDESAQTSGSLKIDQFRKLKNSTGFGAHESQFRMILIPHSDRMTPQASNSVLKLLEETPPGWIFILTANDPTLLLPTLVSRCQILRLKPFSTDEIQELLKANGIDGVKCKICANLAQGSWSRALSFAQPEIWEKRQVFFQFLMNPTTAIQSLIDWCSQDSSNLFILLDIIEQLSADLIRWTTSENLPSLENYSWTNIDGKDALSFHVKQVLRHRGGIQAARDFWIERVEQLAQARQELLAPINRKLLIQNLLLPWIGAAS